MGFGTSEKRWKSGVRVGNVPDVWKRSVTVSSLEAHLFTTAFHGEWLRLVRLAAALDG